MMGFVVKPNFTSLMRNQDSSSEAKKADDGFFGETQFHNIVAKPGIVVGSKKTRGRGFVVKPDFTTLMQNQDLTLEAKKPDDGFFGETRFHNIVAKPGIRCRKQKNQRKRFCGETQFHNIVAKPGFVVGSKKSRGWVFW